MSAPDHHGRGPPPCQEPECRHTAHSRTGYIYCLEHEQAAVVATQGVSYEPIGISNDEFTFFFGASCGSSRKTLRQLEESNVMLSYATASNKPWDGIDTLMIDSGGYSLIARGEPEYPDPVEDYLEYIETHQPEYYMLRDVPATDRVFRNIEGGATESIARTVQLCKETLRASTEYDIDGHPVSILQGTTPDEYVQCFHELVNVGAVTGNLAIGSLKGYSPERTARIVSAIDDVVPNEIKLHGLGVEVPELEYAVTRNALASADSSRYIASARWKQNRDEVAPRLREDEPKAGWFETARTYLDMRESLREVLAVDTSQQTVTAETPTVQSSLTQTSD